MTGDTQQHVDRGTVQLGKKLRPNMRAGRITLFSHPADTVDGFDWIAEKRP